MRYGAKVRVSVYHNIDKNFEGPGHVNIRGSKIVVMVRVKTRMIDVSQTFYALPNPYNENV